MLNLHALRASVLREEPFPYVVVPGFVDAAEAAQIRACFPAIRDGGLFPLSVLSYGPKFSELVDELTAPELSEVFSEKFGVDLKDFPVMITVRGRCNPRDGRVHTDSRTKVLSGLVYFNEGWEHEGARLRLLRSNDINDYVAEVPPDDGTLIAFLRSDHSFHGHLPFSGVRRCIQFNWMINHEVAERELRRHHWSSRTKQVTHAIRSFLP